jgi:DNA polymerase-1
MEYITFSDNNDELKYAIFIKSTSASRSALLNYYIRPLEAYGIPKNEIVVVSVSPDGDKKFKVAPTKEKLIKISKGLKSLDIKHILIANGDLYKCITGVTKTSDCFGEVTKGTLEGYEKIRVTLSIDYSALLYNESLRFKLNHSIETFYKSCKNTFKINKDIIEDIYVPQTLQEIKDVLEALLQYDMLSCDVETESLRFEKARIVTIAFAINKHEGVVFSLDTDDEKQIKNALYCFFDAYQGTLLFHNALYDVKVIIYQIFMESDLDIDGLVEGLINFENVEDSMLVTYLATNSTQESPLGLKENSFEYAGNYGIEFDDEHSVHDYPREEVLEYNLKDALCTWYVYEKYYQQMVDDEQEEIYQEIFQPSIQPLLYMMLIGMPLNMDKVYEAEEQLTTILADIEIDLQKYPAVIKAIARLKEKRFIKDYSDRYGKAKHKDRVKIKEFTSFPDEAFNPNSDRQKSELLYNVLELPVISLTDNKAPSCDNKTLDALIHHTDDPEIKEIISMLQDYAAASIILSTFINNFIKYAFQREDGTWWLNGNLKLGGTQSGRLASSNPNMQNLPSSSKYGKLIKACFEAMAGWLFGGADFSSLEDRINAILTQDPNKIKVYTDGYDGHCLRAYSYFKDQMPGIDPNDVISINSIETKYKSLRQTSKQPTFALTYRGTWHTLVKNLGLTKKEAKSIENNYHILYQVSDEWSEDQIAFATKKGFLNCAFGLKIRTPLLFKTVKTVKNQIYAAEKEGRSALNAVTQSWGMLINRTAIALVKKLLRSEYYDKIFPINTIHDAIYFIFLDDIKTIQWLNNNLVDEMRWNDHPTIKSDDVPMEAALDIGTNWAKQYTLPNYASEDEIEAVRQLVYEK